MVNGLTVLHKSRGMAKGCWFRMSPLLTHWHSHMLSEQWLVWVVGRDGSWAEVENTPICSDTLSSSLLLLKIWMLSTLWIWSCILSWP